MDRTLSVLLFAIAILALGGAGLLLINDFIEYLQIGRWRIESLLDAGYDLNLLKSRWFLASDAGGLIREGLRQIPVFVALLVLGPAAWWLSNRLGSR
jgi:hypothetical protein